MKMDNGHGPVAHSAQVPPYSTQLLISKIRNYDCHKLMALGLSLNPLTPQSIKRLRFGHVLSPTWYHDEFSHHRTSNIYFASCPLIHACLPLLLEASTHFPESKQSYQPNLSNFSCPVIIMT